MMVPYPGLDSPSVIFGRKKSASAVLAAAVVSKVPNVFGGGNKQKEGNYILMVVPSEATVVFLDIFLASASACFRSSIDG